MKPPITLKTLPNATAQEIFDQVKNHLLKQGEKSVADENPMSCMYRGKDGLKCAAGILISDDEYSEGMEHKLFEKIYGLANANCELVMELQHIHDCSMPLAWEGELKKTAQKHNLKYK